MKYDFNDILIEPAELTNIVSRKEVNVFYEDGFLPIFTAPMDTVVSTENLKFFRKNKIKTIVPRTTWVPMANITFKEGNFAALGITEFKDFITLHPSLKANILVDIANGHMSELLELTKTAKEKFGKNLTLMVGNVANPKTYELLSEAGADYIRIGIGNGGGCLTTVQTGVGYPMASLIKECYDISCTLKTPAKIVADGGFKSYSDIIKALALGADYVMLGSILNKALESAGDTYFENIKKEGWTEPGERVNQYAKETEDLFKYGTKMFKKFRGMSTKEAQRAMGKTELKTSEGVTRIQQVEYTLEGWCDNFKSYLSSAMSYSNARNLDEFIGKAKFNLITNNAFNRFNK